MRLKLVVFGGGNMGTALIGGLLGRQWSMPADICVVDPYAPTRDALTARFPGLAVTAGQPEPADAVLIAVKPNDVAGLGDAIRAIGPTVVLSVAAGVRTGAIERVIGGEIAVVRSMPNTPALVGESASAIAGGRWATDEHMRWAKEVLDTVGKTVVVSEAQLDAVTGLSGSGPAYVFLVAESLIEAGVLCGLSRATSRELATQTLVGAATLLRDSGDDAATLRANVTSPGGTTAAGLRALERAGVRSAFLDAVMEATQRSRELGSTT